MTASCGIAVGDLGRYLPPAQPNGRSALVSCAGGERHETGARTAADFRALAGVGVRLLGARVPAANVGAMVARPEHDRCACGGHIRYYCRVR